MTIISEREEDTKTASRYISSPAKSLAGKCPQWLSNFNAFFCSLEFSEAVPFCISLRTQNAFHTHMYSAVYIISFVC